MPTVEEQYGREVKVAPRDGGAFKTAFMVQDAESEDVAYAAVISHIPFFAYGLPFQELTLKEAGPSLWEATVVYGVGKGGASANQQPRIPSPGGGPRPNPDPSQPGLTGDDLVFDFDVGTTTETITRSIKTITKQKAKDYQFDPPDYRGAIEVTERDIKGCKRNLPETKFALKVRYIGSFVTLAFMRQVNKYACHVNEKSWKGFEAGEVLFLGMTGSQKGAGNPELTYKFAYSPNDWIDPDGQFFPQFYKRGWDFVWYRYERKIRGVGPEAVTLPVPQFAYVEQVYPYCDFRVLGIGS